MLRKVGLLSSENKVLRSLYRFTECDIDQCVCKSVCPKAHLPVSTCMNVHASRMNNWLV